MADWIKALAGETLAFLNGGELGRDAYREALRLEKIEQYRGAIRRPPAPPPMTTNGKKWTVEKLAELKAYRDSHTMPQTAAKFGITEQRIRQLLPSEKPKAKPFEGLIHRLK